MKKCKLKFYKILIALAFIAGAFLSFSAFYFPLPQGAYIDGVDVGGMTASAAVKEVRGCVRRFLHGKRLCVNVGEHVYSFEYPEISFTDDLCKVVKGIKRKGKYSAGVKFYLNGIEDIASGIYADVSIMPCEPFACFNGYGEPFTYYEGKAGSVCDKGRIINEIKRSLENVKFCDRNTNFETVNLCVRELSPTNTVDDLKSRTKLLATYSTTFDLTNASRVHNVKLACKKINGCKIMPNAEFSFNGTVGKRTIENGFKQAKIISGGKFIEGVGGGVCQVSTTLYNAALLAGLQIKEVHAHSLSVGYVPPSRDAMVSGTYCDLKFVNVSDSPVYIRALTEKNKLTFSLYGKSDGKKYEVQSKVLESIPMPENVVVKGNEEKVISYGKCGMLSESYLVVTCGDKVEKKRIRRDKYAAMAGIIQIIDD